MLQKVVLVGGTHGNETSGIQLVNHWKQHGLPQHLESLNLDLVIANHNAIENNVRFVDEDLNRQFTYQALDSQRNTIEAECAHTFNQKYGPKGTSATDFVVDIHNTTSNMGATLIILETDHFNTQLARYVKHVMPEAVILVEDEKPFEEHGYLCTVGKKGVMIEVGAQPQGVMREDVYKLVEKMAIAILTFCVHYNENESLVDTPCEAFRLVETISFPLDDNGQRTAMVHRDLQDNDFAPLLPGDPVFRAFSGETIGWWGNEVTFPHFINEAAYSKLHVAFAIADKCEI